MPDTYSIKKDSWNEWAKYVLKTLEDLKKQNEDADIKIDGMSRDTLVAIGKLITKITVLETKMAQKAALTGGVVGASISIIVGTLVFFITRHNV